MSDHIPTLADVCSAIAEGRIAAEADGLMYHVNAYELRRYLNRFRALPPLSFVLGPDSTLSSQSNDWSVSMQTSIV